MRGAWRCCLSCHAQAGPAPADKIWCDVCKVFLPTACFPSTEQRNVCRKHLQTFQQKKTQAVRCSRCGQEREATEYQAAKLKNLQAEERLPEAVCLHCVPEHLPAGWQGKSITCCVCLETLPFSAFSMSWQKQVADKRWRAAESGARCLNCQFPQCSSCGVRPRSLLNTQRAPKSKDDRDKYLCLACTYPNCSNCRRSMEEWRKRKWRSKAKTPGRSWTCPECLR